MPEPVYTTPDALRAELDLDQAALTDDQANRLILFAEDITDELLGAWPIDEDTGRKIAADDVETWQFAKLGRFVTLLAAKLHANPALTDGIQWSSESGPDFAHSGPIGSPLGPGLLSILNASALRRLGARATPGFRSPLIEQFFRVTPSWRL